MVRQKYYLVMNIIDSAIHLFEPYEPYHTDGCIQDNAHIDNTTSSYSYCWIAESRHYTDGLHALRYKDWNLFRLEVSIV